jgi:hypothetical protein
LRLSDWDAVRAHLNSDDDIAQVVVDLWFVNGPGRAIEQLCASGQARHFAYGSGTPVQTAAATAMQLAVADISAGERRQLCRANAERFLHSGAADDLARVGEAAAEGEEQDG